MFPWWEYDLLRYGNLHSCIIQLGFGCQARGSQLCLSCQEGLIAQPTLSPWPSTRWCCISRYTSASSFGVILARKKELKKQLMGEEDNEANRLYMTVACLCTILQRISCSCCCRLMRTMTIWVEDWTPCPCGVVLWAVPKWQMTADTTREHSGLRQRLHVSFYFFPCHSTILKGWKVNVETEAWLQFCCSAAEWERETTY